MKTKMMALGFAAAAAVVSGAISAAVPAMAVDGWVAEAYSPSAPAKLYESWGPRSQATIEADALEQCAAATGKSDCTLAISTGQCGAIAISGNTWYGGSGPTTAAASASARLFVPNGRIIGQHCAWDAVK
jgi:Domain of unknown function (DUF4189)